MLYQNDILELPQKLAVFGGQIDHRLFPGTTSEQVQTLVNSLRAFALRLKDLIDAREYPQASLLVRELIDDVRVWRTAIEELLSSWSNDLATQPGGDLQNRLAASLTKMETRISSTLSLAEAGELGEEDYVNFYRLLGSYRGLSEALVGYAQIAEGVNWTQLEEERF